MKRVNEFLQFTEVKAVDIYRFILVYIYYEYACSEMKSSIIYLTFQ